MLISEWMAPELETEMAMTRNLLAKIPADKLGWKPADGLHTIGWNSAHLAEIVGWVPGILQESEFDMAPANGSAYMAPETSDIPQLLATFDENRAKALAALKGVANSVMEEPWSLKMGGQVIFTMKKGDCLRKWIFSHSAHHRGILSVYLRMAGVQFPSIYEE